jgi:phosphatidylserine decarboxylase
MQNFARLYFRVIPSWLQILISQIFSVVFRTRFSILFIWPYCYLFDLQKSYLQRFQPPAGKARYTSFQDFFKRHLRQPLPATGTEIWHCEGYLCDWGFFRDKEVSSLKGDALSLNQVFGTPAKKTRGHFFVNVFLHNHNYHRVHAPTSGVIKSIRQIRGGLMFLRPWFYPRECRTFPSIHNERLVIEIQDLAGESWWLAMVGGFGVGTIKLPLGIGPQVQIRQGQELAFFELGSTVCIAAPRPLLIEQDLQTVSAGDPMPILLREAYAKPLLHPHELPVLPEVQYEESPLL